MNPPPPAVSAPASRPLCRDCADESVRQGVGPGKAICPHDGLPCTAPASRDYCCTKCGHCFSAVPSRHDPCPRCGYSACPVPTAPASRPAAPARQRGESGEDHAALIERCKRLSTDPLRLDSYGG